MKTISNPDLPVTEEKIQAAADRLLVLAEEVRVKKAVGFLIQGNQNFERYHATIGSRNLWLFPGNRRGSVREAIKRALFPYMFVHSADSLRFSWHLIPPHPYHLETRCAKRDMF